MVLRSLVRVSGPVKAQLDAIKARLERERDRQVTYSEVIEQQQTAAAELDRIDAILRAYGFEYPLGARAVEDLAFAYAVRQRELHNLRPDEWAAMDLPDSGRSPGMYRVRSGE
jgi:hypothetical protein